MQPIHPSIHSAIRYSLQCLTAACGCNCRGAKAESRRTNPGSCTGPAISPSAKGQYEYRHPAADQHGSWEGRAQKDQNGRRAASITGRAACALCRCASNGGTDVWSKWTRAACAKYCCRRHRRTPNTRHGRRSTAAAAIDAIEVRALITISTPPLMPEALPLLSSASAVSPFHYTTTTAANNTAANNGLFRPIHMMEIRLRSAGYRILPRFVFITLKYSSTS